MPPNNVLPSGLLNENDDILPGQQILDGKKIDAEYKPKLLWLNVTIYTLLHLNVLYAFYAMFTTVKVYTIIFAFFMYILAGFGLAAGVHRLWSHRAYKAKLPLKLFLTFCNTLGFEDAIIHWARDHRLHHKYSDTDADPYNASRGFFFSHVGWLLVRKHPLVIAKGRTIDVSDLYADPVLLFQKRNYLKLAALITFAMPICTPMYFWGETFGSALSMCFLRLTANLHATWLVNSAAHMFGNKPYDRFMSPTQNWVTVLFAHGDGWHNYHHAFPWDYKSSELGKYSINLTTSFIELMAKLGLAYDLRSPTEESVKRRVQRAGDGSHHLWGYGDKDQSQEEIKSMQITHKIQN